MTKAGEEVKPATVFRQAKTKTHLKIEGPRFFVGSEPIFGKPS